MAEGAKAQIDLVIRANTQQFAGACRGMTAELNKVTGMSSGLAKLSGGFKNLAASMVSSWGLMGGVAVVGTLVAGLRNAVAYAGKIQDLSDRFGVSTDSLQEFEYAAQKSGSSIEGVATAIKGLSRSMAAGAGGGKSQLDAFARMGISLEDLKSKKPEDVFRMIAASVERLPASAQVTADAMTLMGRSGDELLAAFRNGFGETTKQFREMGGVIDADVIGRLDDVGDKFSLLTTRLRSGFAYLADGLLAIFSRLEAGIAWASTLIGNFTVTGSIGKAYDAAKAKADEIFNAYEKKKVAPVISQGAFEEDQSTAQAAADKAAEAARKAERKVAQDWLSGLADTNLARPAADALARIGGLRSGGGTSSLLNQQLQRLVSIEVELKKLNREVAAE